MKKLLYLLICLPLIFSSCKKEDDSSSDNSNSTSASILGTWEIASTTSTSNWGYLDPIHAGEIMTSSETYSENYPTVDGMTFFWAFASDGTYIETYYSNGALDLIYTSNYLKQGNNLSMYMDSLGNVGITYTITTLTNSALSCNFSYSENWTEGDTTFIANITESMTFNKSNKKIDSSIQSQNKTGKTPFFKQFIDRKKR